MGIQENKSITYIVFVCDICIIRSILVVMPHAYEVFESTWLSTKQIGVTVLYMPFLHLWLILVYN